MQRKLIKLLNQISLCGMVAVGLIGAAYEILGHGRFEKLCSALGVPNGFQLIWISGLAVLFVWGVTHFLMNKKS